MSEIFNRFSLENAKFNAPLFWGLFLIWAVLVFCAITSIRSQNFSERKRHLWMWIVICVPLVGMLLYVPFSIRKEDLPQLILLKLQKDRLASKAKKSALLTEGRSP